MLNASRYLDITNFPDMVVLLTLRWLLNRPLMPVLFSEKSTPDLKDLRLYIPLHRAQICPVSLMRSKWPAGM